MKQLFLIGLLTTVSLTAYSETFCNEVARRADISDLTDQQLLACQSELMSRAMCNQVSKYQSGDPKLSMMKTPEMLSKECLNYVLKHKDGLSESLAK